MKSLQPYLRILKKLEAQTQIHLQGKHMEDRISISGVTFSFHANSPGEFPQGGTSQGILVKTLDPEMEKYYRDQAISFLTSTGKLHLIGRRFILDLKLLPRQRTKLSVPKENRPQLREQPRPTTLISPNGLAILDALFRLPPHSLDEFKSALSFVHKFRLNQSKLSLMMKELHAKTLPELRNQISELPDLWWHAALRYSLTRKRLQPFFEVEKSYRSLSHELPSKQTHSILKEWLEKRMDLLPGPIEVAKAMSLMRDTDTYLWGTPAALQDFKAAFRLIPDSNTGENSWHLATIVSGFEKGAVLSPLAHYPREFLFREIKSNLFRAVWDLQFGGNRAQEIQTQALRRIINGI